MVHRKQATCELRRSADSNVNSEGEMYGNCRWECLGWLSEENIGGMYERTIPRECPKKCRDPHVQRLWFVPS